MKKKKAYTAPKVVSEPLKIGVFGDYGGIPHDPAPPSTGEGLLPKCGG